jgi:hypothetical protein
MAKSGTATARLEIVRARARSRCSRGDSPPGLGIRSRPNLPRMASLASTEVNRTDMGELSAFSGAPTSDYSL